MIGNLPHLVVNAPRSWRVAHSLPQGIRPAVKVWGLVTPKISALFDGDEVSIETYFPKKSNLSTGG